MRAMFGCTAAVLALSFNLVADDKKDEKIDTAKLVSKWEEKNTQDGEMVVMELTKDNKVHFTISGGKKDMTVDGTYKVAGSKITLTIAYAGENHVMELTVDKLTDEDLSLADDKKSAKTFKKLKGK
jgi:uncharacterized protein (TIGR03066 family)